jgi:hypothetical protein
MKLIIAIIFLIHIFAIAVAPAKDQTEALPAAAQQKDTWQILTDGLELGVFQSPLRSEIGDSLIRVLRIDPYHYAFRLLNASATQNGRALSAKEWCRQHGLAAAINASMYQADYKTSVSLMRTKGHVNNARMSRDMTVLAFERLIRNVPPVKIIDRQCEDFSSWKTKYGTFVQSIRMISCTGENVWQQQAQKWSTAAIATDHQDRVLFIHVGSPFSTHDLIDILKLLPLDITRAMYAEGGPQAQVYINAGAHEHEFVGGYELPLSQESNALFSWPIPNVVGISLKDPSTK